MIDASSTVSKNYRPGQSAISVKLGCSSETDRSGRLWRWCRSVAFDRTEMTHVQIELLQNMMQGLFFGLSRRCAPRPDKHRRPAMLNIWLH
jgi:hypothetical protein